jgi:hypothetical protein
MAAGDSSAAGGRVRRALVTQPRRRFRPDDLAALSRDDRRKLMQVLLTEGGARVVEVHRPAGYDELVLQVTPLWHPRRVRVRIATRRVEQADIDRLAEAVATAGDAEGLSLAGVGHADGLRLPADLALVGADELVARLERSALVAWPQRRPVPAYDRVASQRALERDAALLDPVGLRWLPVLALNELPADLADRDLAPQDLLERMTFRVFSGTLRFGGRRYGESARGQRLPDAVLRWPAGAQRRLAALLDCKASAAGYTMESDHFLRFADYVETLRSEIEEGGDELRYMVVVSSDYAGGSGGSHPFHNRARTLHDRTGLRLVYLRALDLARAGAAVEGRSLQPTQREALDWEGAFDQGLVTAEHIDAMLDAID